MTPNVEIENMEKKPESSRQFSKITSSCLTFPEFKALWVFSVSSPRQKIPASRSYSCEYQCTVV